jgi:hypothetical protein
VFVTEVGVLAKLAQQLLDTVGWRGTSDRALLAAPSMSATVKDQPVISTPEEYLDAAPEQGRPWLREFWDYVSATYPSLELTMFRQTPMFKFDSSYLDGYVMFTAAKSHFAAHAIDFDLVEDARARIEGARGGKGNVAVRYTNEDAKPGLRDFVDAVMARHGIPTAVR